MKTKKSSVDFFMGANTPDGFYSLFNELQQPQEGIRRYLIKGGPGTGKSGIMKKAATAFTSKDKLLEKIHCSADPNSLDGIILHSGNASIVDATPPHVIEPTYPGGFETVINLCDYFYESKLEKRLATTVLLQKTNTAYHKKCRGLLKCADILLKYNYYFIESCTNLEKVSSVAARICKKELTKTDGCAKEHRRMLSAVTNQGIVTFSDTVFALCNKIYLIRDEYGVAANALLHHIRLDALQKGYEIFTCVCPLSPEQKLEHIFIPDLNLGFITQTRFNDFSNIKFFKAINFTRFTDMETLRIKKQYLRFNRKAAAELIQAAVDALKQAKINHDKLEKQYNDAVDFEKVTQKTNEIIKKIAKRYEH